MTSAKHPSAAFWATIVLVVALVAYPLSFGPACWVAMRRPSLITAVARMYWPLTRIAWLCPGRIVLDPLFHYAEWGEEDDLHEVSMGPSFGTVVVAEIFLYGRPGRRNL